MKFRTFLGAACLFLAASAVVSSTAVAPALKKSVATYPWIMNDGTPTAVETAYKALSEIASKNGYDALPLDTAKAAYTASGIPHLSAVGGPTTAQLVKFGKKAGVNYVVYGVVTWRTRSIWVGAGPKTIASCNVDASVIDVDTGKVTYSKKGVTGRSDEKEDAVKLAGAVLITPLITAVSGGPKTPQQQRAVQIALARAFVDWNKQIGK